MSRSSTISSTTSSFHEVGTPGSDSEDEIVYSVASLPELEQPQTPCIFSDGDEDDDDYVVLRRRPAGAQGPDSATGSGVATPSAEGATRTSGRGSSSGALRGQVMVVQLRSQLKALSINTQSPTSPTTKRTGTSMRTYKKPREDDSDGPGESKFDARASGLPTPDITPLKERKQLQPSGSASLAAAVITPSSPQGVATPTPVPSVGKKKLKKAKKAAAAAKALSASTDSALLTATTSDGAKKGKKKKKERSKKATTTTTTAANASSEAKRSKAGQVDRSMVLEASTYITSYLSNPKAQTNSVCRLTLLQSLIIELGLMTSALKLPPSLRSATAFIKSHAFLNIKEYVSVRAQGPDAVRKILFPSRSALVKDIRKKRNPVSLKWVKEHGLQVLLVGCF
ncbi:hypothetical protein EST38_g7883 [Candolleomyces aberdarensis]|uniref:Uncharacterized protein n=1 Tax=Candolleomyces aberdarensis TaxID=2316362 RepID=A0A4Q2DE25_9AGAR|nr:hypothetical protein EST38_g7883 [Candolleomyces aberdarensis]